MLRPLRECQCTRPEDSLGQEDDMAAAVGEQRTSLNSSLKEVPGLPSPLPLPPPCPSCTHAAALALKEGPGTMTFTNEQRPLLTVCRCRN